MGCLLIYLYNIQSLDIVVFLECVRLCGLWVFSAWPCMYEQIHSARILILSHVTTSSDNNFFAGLRGARLKR
jgi:hypothetical protein